VTLPSHSASGNSCLLTACLHDALCRHSTWVEVEFFCGFMPPLPLLYLYLLPSFKPLVPWNVYLALLLSVPVSSPVVFLLFLPSVEALVTFVYCSCTVGWRPGAATCTCVQLPSAFTHRYPILYVLGCPAHFRTINYGL
jgi:hypothetical protein